MNPLLEERIKLFKETARCNNNERVLNFGNIWAWPIAEAGESLEKASRDYDLRIKILSDFQERYQFDLYADIWSRNPMLVSDALGGGTFVLTDDPFVIATDDRDYIVAPEDYDNMREDFIKYLWTKMIPRKLPNLLEGDSLTMMKNASTELDKYLKYNDDITRIMKDKYGTMCLFAGDTEYLEPYLDSLNFDLRGMKGLSADIRRHPEKLLEFLDAFGVYGLADASRERGSNPNKPADYTTTCLAHTFLSAKQFEKFYFPYLKMIFDYAEEYDKIHYFFLEGHNERFYDYFAEAPAGHFIFHMEKDDLFEAKKFFEGKNALAGGMPAILLNSGTQQECVDYAKHLIDSLSYDGGYMISQDIMMSYPADGKPENLLAVCEYINSYYK
jgi:hypothetical protein